MKEKITTKMEYKQWHQGPNIPRPGSMAGGNSSAKRQETAQSRADDYSDEDYEEGFEDNADGAEDEMEKIRRAMAKEKEKAKKFQERQVIQKPQKVEVHNPLKQGGGAPNVL